MHTIKAELKHDKASHSFKTSEDDKKTSEVFFISCVHIWRKYLNHIQYYSEDFKNHVFEFPIDTSFYIIQRGSSFTPQKVVIRSHLIFQIKHPGQLENKRSFLKTPLHAMR